MLFDLKSSEKKLLGISLKDVVYQIENGHFPLHSKIFNPLTQAWESISENPRLARMLALRLDDQPISFNYDSLFYHWILKNFVSDKGFFSLMEVIEKLQKREITEKTLVKHPRVRLWTEIKKLPIFSDESVRALHELQALQSYFNERKDPRPGV